MNKGKVIVLEGLDGCGKSTQLELLHRRLSEKRECRLISFPNYDSSTGRVVSDYLAGNIPCESQCGAYAASAFYAADRYASFVTDWQKDYNSGKLIVSGRYATSNAVYQMTKLPENEWDGFLDWLWDFEYNKLGLPKPDRVIYLDMPVEISQLLLLKRYGGDNSQKDIHESKVDFLKACRKSAIYTAKKCGWKIIDCSDGEKPLSIEQTALIIQKETEDI